MRYLPTKDSEAVWLNYYHGDNTLIFAVRCSFTHM